MWTIGERRIKFMERLIRSREQKIFLVLDNLRVHHSKPVKKWLAEHTGQIEAFFLPSYSPGLNPNELLNADLKKRVTRIAPARTKTALTRTAICALPRIQKQPDHVECYFQPTKECRLCGIGSAPQGRTYRTL
jgi:transposase